MGDSSNLATIALLGGLGSGIGQSSGYYPSYGAHPASAHGRKRRQVDVGEDDEDDLERKRREICEAESGNPDECRRKRSEGEGENEGEKRRRRETCYNEKGQEKPCSRKRRGVEGDGDEKNGQRKRREVCYNEKGDEEACRRKRQSPCDNTENNANCDRKR